jgi:Uncharacterized protein conserved in bacteria (DUF2184)
MSKVSKTHSALGPRSIRALELEQKHVGDAAVRKLQQLGVFIDPQFVRDQVDGLYRGSNGNSGLAMDAAFTPQATVSSIPTPLQFLQYWLPGFVKVITSARKIDKIVGLNTTGSWEDQEIVQGIVESSATVQEYGDYTNVPLASWNTNFERRTIVRGELGIQVGMLEEGRSAAMRLSSAEEKRQACSISLETFRNAVGFYGWNNGNNRTFGFLNDPNLPAWVSVAAGQWNTKTFLQIIADIRVAVAALRTQSQDIIDPEETDLTLVLPTAKVDFLTVVSDFGISVRDWLTQTYKKIHIISAPELNGANGGADGFVLFADKIDSSADGSSDGGQTFVQVVPNKLYTLGVEKRIKSYVEGFSNATAGVMLKRPWAVIRYTGI